MLKILNLRLHADIDDYNENIVFKYNFGDTDDCNTDIVFTVNLKINTIITKILHLWSWEDIDDYNEDIAITVT